MMTDEKVYRTVQEARNALALDTGFDPFRTGHIRGRCTKAKLSELGYVVDPKQAAERSQEHRCSVCQVTVKEEWDGLKMYYPDTCETHRKWRFACDNGHVWHATTAEDDAAEHKCPTCGEYWQ
jgi:hypothetical protein